MDNHPERKWLSFFDKIALIASFCILLLLVYFYYAIAVATRPADSSWQSLLLALGESLIIEFIPVFFLFVCSYFLLRFYEDRRAAVTNEEITSAVIEGVRSAFGEESSSTNQSNSGLQDRELFEVFWGPNSIARGVTMVYGTRRLDENKRDALIPSYNACANAESEGVRSWLSYEDIRASTYLTQTLANNGVSIYQFLDTEEIRSAQDRCYIALGLGFNGMTGRLERLFDDPKLFEIECTESIKKPDLWTDGFKIGGRGLAKDPRNVNSSEIKHPDAGWDYALVARVVTSRDGRNVSFVCAGRTAAGTAAAGHFLANHWRQLLELYKGANKYRVEYNLNLDSVAVIIKHLEARSQDIISDMDDTGRITNEYVFGRTISLSE